MEYIYHYTSLETLALILKHNTIRFSKLSALDDPLEKYVNAISYTPGVGKVKKGCHNIGGLCFVSCWSREEDESIPMWQMYGDNGEGVRIGMPIDMFDSEYDPNQKTKKARLFEIEHKPFSIDFFDIDYNRISDPTFSDWERTYYDNIGKFKIPEWSFQRECRFRIFAVAGADGKCYYRTSEGMDKCPSFEPSREDSIFFPLNQDAICHMKVLSGPKMSEGKHELLAALVEKYGLRTDNSKFEIMEIEHDRCAIELKYGTHKRQRRLERAFSRGEEAAPVSQAEGAAGYVPRDQRHLAVTV